MDYVPQILMDWGMKNIGQTIVDIIKSYSEKLPPMYLELRKENRDMYEQMNEKLAKIGVTLPLD